MLRDKINEAVKGAMKAQEKLKQLQTPHVQMLVTSDKQGGKPHQLNLGLKMAQGDVVTIFDAEGNIINK